VVRFGRVEKAKSPRAPRTGDGRRGHSTSLSVAGRQQADQAAARVPPSEFGCAGPKRRLPGRRSPLLGAGLREGPRQRCCDIPRGAVTGRDESRPSQPAPRWRHMPHGVAEDRGDRRLDRRRVATRRGENEAGWSGPIPMFRCKFGGTDWEKAEPLGIIPTEHESRTRPRWLDMAGPSCEASRRKYRSRPSPCQGHNSRRPTG
jgi:hypothetical protein